MFEIIRKLDKRRFYYTETGVRRIPRESFTSPYKHIHGQCIRRDTFGKKRGSRKFRRTCTVAVKPYVTTVTLYNARRARIKVQTPNFSKSTQSIP